MWRQVLDFWFGEIQETPEWFGQKLQFWFAGTPEMDRVIRDRFEHLIAGYKQTGLPDWESDARGVLAKIILLDQFPRNLFRGQAEAFAYDSDARCLAAELIKKKGDETLHSVERLFVYLPFEHSEDPCDQELSVQYFKQLAQDAPASLQDGLNITYDYALKHQEVIQKFGRFPHRNQALGRHSTAAEQEYLARPGSGF